MITITRIDTSKDGGRRIGGDHIIVGHAETASLDIDAAAWTLARTDSSNWDSVYKVGQKIQITGIDAIFAITNVEGAKLSLTRLSGSGALVRSIGVQTTLSFAGIGGPDSPLVVYGDTSQDGVWFEASVRPARARLRAEAVRSVAVAAGQRCRGEPLGVPGREP